MEDKLRARLVMVRVRCTMTMHKASRLAHRIEVPCHAAYFGLLGFGFHELYVWAALVMFVVVIVANVAPGGGSDA